MDDLYGDILALLAHLRSSGHPEEARQLLEALTHVCNARDVLDNLRAALGDLPKDLNPELKALQKDAEAKIENLWKELGAP